MEQQDYTARNGISVEDAQVLGPIFARMEQDGRLNATNIVHDASQPGSPLRRFFEWDNLKAAHEHRLERARHLWSSVRIPMRSRDEPGSVRAFVAIPRQRDPATKPLAPGASKREIQGHVWVSRETAKSEAWMRKELRNRALRQIKHWEAEFSDWAEKDQTFRPVLLGIQETRRLFELESQEESVRELAEVA